MRPEIQSQSSVVGFMRSYPTTASLWHRHLRTTRPIYEIPSARCRRSGPDWRHCASRIPLSGSRYPFTKTLATHAIGNDTCRIARILAFGRVRQQSGLVPSPLVWTLPVRRHLGTPESPTLQCYRSILSQTETQCATPPAVFRCYGIAAQDVLLLSTGVRGPRAFPLR